MESKLEDIITSVVPPKKLLTASYLSQGAIPVVDQSQQTICGWTNDAEAVVKSPLPLIVFGDHTCVIKLLDQPFAQGADGIKIFRSGPAVDTEYLFHNLSNRPLVMEDYRRHFSSLKERRVHYPDPRTGEQRKIAACLTSLDKLLAAEERRLEALQVHKKGLMQQLFPSPGEFRPRLRFHEFRDEPEWTSGRASDFVDVLQGYGFPERLQGNKDGEFPFYKVSDISAAADAGKILLTDAKNHIGREVLVELRAKPLPIGTTVFAKIGEAIRSNKRAMTTRPCLIDNNAAGVKAIAGAAVDEFVYYYWCMVPLIMHAGGVVPAVNKSAIEQISVCFPEPAEQQRIASCLGSLDALITAALKKLDGLRAHKNGLMQQLFPSPEGV